MIQRRGLEDSIAQAETLTEIVTHAACQLDRATSPRVPTEEESGGRSGATPASTARLERLFHSRLADDLCQ